MQKAYIMCYIKIYMLLVYAKLIYTLLSFVCIILLENQKRWYATCLKLKKAMKK